MPPSRRRTGKRVSRIRTALPSLPAALQEALAQLPRGPYEHIGRVRQLAAKLAAPLGLNLKRVDLAAAAHDIARAEKGEALLARARALGLPVHPVEAKVPILLHGPVAAESLRQAGVINDAEVLEAIRWHSTGHPTLRALGQVVFLADKLDPAKGSRTTAQERLLELARQDLNAAMLEILTLELQALLRRGRLVHPASVEARNALLERLGKA